MGVEEECMDAMEVCVPLALVIDEKVLRLLPWLRRGEKVRVNARRPQRKTTISSQLAIIVGHPVAHESSHPFGRDNYGGVGPVDPDRVLGVVLFIVQRRTHWPYYKARGSTDDIGQVVVVHRPIHISRLVQKHRDPQPLEPEQRPEQDDRGPPVATMGGVEPDADAKRGHMVSRRTYVFRLPNARA